MHTHTPEHVLVNIHTQTAADICNRVIQVCRQQKGCNGSKVKDNIQYIVIIVIWLITIVLYYKQWENF